MTAVAPRAVVPPNVSASSAAASSTPTPGDRAAGAGPGAFEAVLRGHSQRPAPGPARPGSREHGHDGSRDRRPGPTSPERGTDASGAVGPDAAPTGATAPTAAPDSAAPAVTPASSQQPADGSAPSALAVPAGTTPPVAGVPSSGGVAGVGQQPGGAASPGAGAVVPGAGRPAVAPGPVPTRSPGGQAAAADASAVASPMPAPAVGDPAPAPAADGDAAAAGGPDGVVAAGTAAGSVAARTSSPDTAPAAAPAADQVRAGLDRGAPPTSGGGTVDGSPAYALTPAGAAPGGTATPVATTADVRPAQPALPPQAQVLRAVSPLLTTADGTHRLTVHLAPAHLGSVQVHLEVRGGEVAVRLTAVDPATGDALRQGTAELRSHLERVGLRSGGIDVQVAPADTGRDPGQGGSTTDRGPRDQGQRDPGPWAAEPGDTGGDPSRDGTWQRHGRPLDGWTSRAGGADPGRDAPTNPDPTDPLRPRPRDVRVDVRM